MPRLIGELIRRMSRRELMELSGYLDWDEIEEWKATSEVVADNGLRRRVKTGLSDEKRGKVRPATPLLDS
ncbi:MAG: hypothetical protein HZB91_12205 [Elusimicrobia bacterium]|nr:hypothetical protein [Elusimicrobiota bacterium]